MKNEITKIISNCPLCDEKSLHIVGDDELQVQQCINCGYVTSEKFNIKSTKEENLEYQNLPEDMKNWSKETLNYIWMPTIMTLPFGMLYPVDIVVPNDNKDKVMKWAYAKMVDIPEEEQKNYPDERGGYFEKKYDIENQKIFDEFINAMVDINKMFKQDLPEEVDFKLPKLKKI